MNRAVLEACFPCLIALAVSFLLLWALAKLSGCRPRWRRLTELHDCQAGGVQSLAFVFTLPVFLMIVLFIVQVSQVMIGMMTVNYAAYASARAASVWVPAEVDDYNGIDDDDGQNRLPPGLRPGAPLVLTYDSVQSLGSAKYEEMFSAAAMACMSIAPSRDLPGNMGRLGSTRVDEATLNVYPQLAPSAGSNARMPQRIRNKLAYSLDNTVIEISYVDKDSTAGPTYNPSEYEGHVYLPHEVGWQDAVTVKVWHHFGLLPGPGHFLSNVILRRDGRPDLVARRIDEEDGMHKTWLSASATMTVEGLKSSRPYRHQQW
jgi:hypothetical protein